MAKSTAAKPVTYPGELGKHGQIAQLVFREVFQGPHAPGSPEIHEYALQLTSDHQFRMLDLLAEHFGISNESLLMRHALLALRLAKEHVPAFQYGKMPRRGRPRKAIVSEQLKSMFMNRGLGQFGDTPKKKRGAPQKWEGRMYAKLLELLDRGSALLRAQNRRVTNEDAFVAVYQQMQRDGHAPDWTARQIRSEAKFLAKRVSDAKKSLRKMPGK
jgi:hypothetical protein